jgi:gluconolactonase
MNVAIRDERFRRVVGHDAPVEELATGFDFTEGAVWNHVEGHLIFSDMPGDVMRSWTTADGIQVFRQPSNMANGNTFDLQGRLITCEHATSRVTRTEHDGSITVLMDSFEGKRLSSPNDVVVHSDGSVWFTDPGYGIMLNYEGQVAEAELPTRVYRLDPDSGEATIVADDFLRPNGLCFSPDEELLYIVDTGSSHDPNGPSHIRVFDVTADNRLENGRLFVDMKPGMADGIRCDEDGNLWAAAGWAGPGFDGVHCYAPDGTRIGQIHLPEICANLCFGGAGKNRLFMAGSQSLYAVYVETAGAQQP